MKCYRCPSHDVRENLALEEKLFRSTTGDMLLLWQNEPCIVIGKHQVAEAEVLPEILQEGHLPVVRRITGGGAVYHDLGNLNFSFLTDDISRTYMDFLNPVIQALEKFHVHAVYNERNDLLVEGKKISGNAQLVAGNRMLHHGTLLFDTDLERLGQVLQPHPEKLARNEVSSVTARVGNLKDMIPDKQVTLEQIAQAIVDVVGEL